MRIIKVKTLRDFWARHKDAEEPLKAWFHETKIAKWRTPNEVKAQYLTASILRKSRVVFNIAGNKYRLVVAINYTTQIVYIRFIGTHKEYDGIDPEVI